MEGIPGFEGKCDKERNEAEGKAEQSNNLEQAPGSIAEQPRPPHTRLAVDTE